jgi:hypothetical protein
MVFYHEVHKGFRRGRKGIKSEVWKFAAVRVSTGIEKNYTTAKDAEISRRGTRRF